MKSSDVKVHLENKIHQHTSTYLFVPTIFILVLITVTSQFSTENFRFNYLYRPVDIDV